MTLYVRAGGCASKPASSSVTPESVSRSSSYLPTLYGDVLRIHRLREVRQLHRTPQRDGVRVIRIALARTCHPLHEEGGLDLYGVLLRRARGCGPGGRRHIRGD